MVERLASTGSRGQMHAENKGSLREGIGTATLLGLLAAVPLCLVTVSAVAADNASRGPSEATFLVQIVVLLVCGRLMGELMQRIGQPPVMGQLIAGILLGPSALGALWPALQQSLFPTNPDQKAMIDAVAQLGILLLLL